MKQIEANPMTRRIVRPGMLPDYTLLTALLMATTAQAQISKPREKASDYMAHIQVPRFELAAEYLTHSLPGPRGMIFISDYLVVEVAAYPNLKAGAAWSTDQFTLRINKKNVLFPQTAGMVAASVKYPDWVQRPRVTAGAGMGNGGVIMGQPAGVGRFPGDPRGEENRVPRPKAPEPENPTGQPPESELSIEELCQRQALRDGAFTGPASGYLFFAFKGKLKSIHSIELVYQPEGGVGEPAKLPLL